MNDELEDQLWFDALQGKAPKGHSRSPTEVQASALRSSVLRSISARPALEPTTAGFEKMLAEAKRRGLLKPEESAWKPADVISRAYDFLALPSSVTASVVIVVVLGATTGWQAMHINGFQEDSIRYGDVMRGGAGDSVAQLTSSPEEATEIAQVWQKDLLTKGIAHSVSFETPTKILIRMRLTPATIELLEERRILPPKGEWCTVSIEAAQAKP